MKKTSETPVYDIVFVVGEDVNCINVPTGYSIITDGENKAYNFGSIGKQEEWPPSALDQFPYAFLAVSKVL
jgi:hypothetical protein